MVLTEMGTFEQWLQGVSHENTWGTAFLEDETANAKALRQECACHICSTEKTGVAGTAKWEKKSSKRWSNLPEVPELVCVRAELWHRQSGPGVWAYSHYATCQQLLFPGGYCSSSFNLFQMSLTCPSAHRQGGKARQRKKGQMASHCNVLDHKSRLSWYSSRCEHVPTGRERR